MLCQYKMSEESFPVRVQGVYEFHHIDRIIYYYKSTYSVRILKVPSKDKVISWNIYASFHSLTAQT